MLTVLRELDEEVRWERPSNTIEVVVDSYCHSSDSLGRIVEGVEQAAKLAQGN